MSELRPEHGRWREGAESSSARKMNCRAGESEWNLAAMTPWGVGRRQGTVLGPRNVCRVRKMLPVLLELIAQCRRLKLINEYSW